jgi:hypothetical protein
MGTTKSRLTIAAGAIHQERLAVDDPDQRFLGARAANGLL